MSTRKNSFTRRRLLKSLLTSSALLGFAPFAFASSQKHRQSSSMLDLSFSDSDGIGPIIDAPDVAAHMIPLHKEIYVPKSESSQQYHQLHQALKSEFTLQNENWSDDYKIQLSYQHYGFRDNSSSCLKLLEYCQAAQTYLYENVENLTRFSTSWSMLTDSMNLISSNGNYALAGKYTYFVMRINAIDAEHRKQGVSLINAKPVNRAIHYISDTDERSHDPDQQLIYVISGNTSLVSPFSEIVHMSTHYPAMQYARELEQHFDKPEAMRIAKNSGETITEAAAIMLALDFIFRISKSDRSHQIIQHANSLSRQLPAFAPAIAHMQKQGVQAAIDIYMESPAQYMKLISNTA